jgi:hypothetical protein
MRDIGETVRRMWARDDIPRAINAPSARRSAQPTIHVLGGFVLFSFTNSGLLLDFWIYEFDTWCLKVLAFLCTHSVRTCERATRGQTTEKCFPLLASAGGHASLPQE